MTATKEKSKGLKLATISSGALPQVVVENSSKSESKKERGTLVVLLDARDHFIRPPSGMGSVPLSGLPQEWAVFPFTS
jgi:hypothetical protein